MERLKLKSDFRRIFEARNSVSNRLVVLRWTFSSGPGKVGFVVSKRAGGAVVRNRLKRRLREAVRLEAGTLVPGARAVLIPRPGVGEADFGELRKAITQVLRRAGLTTG